MANDDDDSLPPLGENTDKFLDQAKKGQARNFLLVCKGTKVNYLTVRKKPIKKNELNEAKKAGYKGEGYFGVITGKGMELVFNLSTADGYTSEPVKDKILKDFLEEKADFKCKPTIVIVATLPDVPFDEEELKNPLVARFLALSEKIPQVLDVNPNAEAELKQMTSEIRSLLLDADFEAAEPKVNGLEERLNELLGQTTESTSAPADSLRERLQERLNSLVPQVKQALAVAPQYKQELLTLLSGIKTRLDENRELTIASDSLIALEERIQEVLSESESTRESTNGTSPLPLDEVEALLLEAKRTFPNDAIKYQGIWDLIQNRIANGDIEKARGDLAQFAAKLRQALSNKPKNDAERFGIEEGIVKVTREKLIEAFKKSKLVWERTRGSIQSELRKLEQAILTLSAQEEDYEDIKANSGKVYIMLDELDDSLITLLDQATNTQDEQQRTQRHQEAQQTVQRYFDYLQENQFLRDVDSNAFAAVKVRATLEASLTALRKGLAIRLEE